MTQGHPEAHALPLHAAGQNTVSTADAVIGTEDDLGTDGVGEAGNQRPGGAEGSDGVLLDGEGMQISTDAVGSFQPFFFGSVLRCEVRLPESDVAHTANAVDHDLLCTLCLQRGDLFHISGQVFLGSKVSLILGNSQFTQRAVECFGHSVLESCGIRAGQSVAVSISPLVHVEAIDVLAVDVQLLQEVNSPLVHAHGADRQDQNQLTALFLGLLDLHCDLEAHVSTELFQVGALNGSEALVPEVLTVACGRGIIGNALQNLGDIPTLGKYFREVRTLQSIQHIHKSFPP